MSRFRSLKAHFLFSVLLPWIFFYLVPPVLAEVEVIADGEFIHIQGLSLPCLGCKVVQENYCKIPSRSMLIPCDKLLEYLLLNQAHATPITETQSAETRVKPEEYLKPDELLRYLLVSDAGGRVAIASLQLLLKNEQGRAAVIRQADALIARQSEALVSVLIQHGTTEEVLASLWKVPTIVAPSKEMANKHALRGIIAALSSQLTFDDLISELSITDQAADLEQLKNWKRALQQLPALSEEKTAWIKNLMQLELIIFSCHQIVTFADLNQKCRASVVESASLTRFRERLYLQRVVTLASPLKVPASEILTGLATTNYRDYRTPEAHQLIVTALEQVAKDPRSSEMVMKHPSVRVMLQTFSETDRTISQLVQSALYKQDSPSRLALSNVGRSMLVWVAIVVFLVFGALLLRRKRTKLDARDENNVDALLSSDLSNNLSNNERIQLRELSRYFGLPVWTSEEKLNKEYRRRAKMLHPDTLGSSVGSTAGSAAFSVDQSGEEFTVLNEKYRILKVLLAKQNSRTSSRFRGLRSSSASNMSTHSPS